MPETAAKPKGRERARGDRAASEPLARDGEVPHNFGNGGLSRADWESAVRGLTRRKAWMTEYHCPNCGASFGPQLDSTRMLNCEPCGTSVFIEDDRLRQAGAQGVMHDGPMLMALHDSVELGWGVVRVLGHARFSYGRGSWDA